MRKHSIDDQELVDAMLRLPGAVWFSILEALGPTIAAKAIDNMRDLGVLYSDNPYAEHFCNTLAAGESEAIHGECPLLGVKRTSRFLGRMSAFDPKRTLPSANLTTSNLPV